MGMMGVLMWIRGIGILSELHRTSIGPDSGVFGGAKRAMGGRQRANEKARLDQVEAGPGIA